MVLCYATPAQDKQPKKPNAAPLYLKAIEEMQSALTDPQTKKVVMPRGDDMTAGEWRDAVAKAAVACTLFTAATQIPGCLFPPVDDSDETGLRSKILPLVNLHKLVAARGLQQTTKDARGACTTALQLLQYARHCSQDPTIMGLALSHDAEASAVRILERALPRLAVQKDAKSVARRFQKQLGDHIKNRPTRRDLADTAMHEFTWLLKSGFSEEAKKNPMIHAARTRAGAIYNQMLQPLRDDPAIADEEFRTKFEGRIAELRKFTGRGNVGKILESGKGEALAAALVLLATTNIARFVETHTEQTKQLEECRQLLIKFLGEDQSSASSDKKKTARKENAVDLYLMAIAEARRAFDVPAGQMLNLPHEASVTGYRSDFWVDRVKKAGMALSLFAQATQVKSCHFEHLGLADCQLEELGQVLLQLRALVFAHAIQNVEQRPHVAMADASCLLDHSRQLSHLPSLQAMAIANVAENAALTILHDACRSAATLGMSDDLAHYANKLRKHREQRGSLEHLATVAHDEVMATLPRFCDLGDTHPYRQVLSRRVAKVFEPVANFAKQPPGDAVARLEKSGVALRTSVRKNALKTLAGEKEADACIDRLLLPRVAQLASLLRKHEELTELLDERQRELK